MPISYRDKVNQRPIGSEQLILNESHVIGITGIDTVSSNQIRLVEVPYEEIPSSVAISGFTEVTTTPGTNEFLVDYTSGRIDFHPSRNGQTVLVTYKGRGSMVDAEDINELQDPVGVALDPDGEITAGHVKPISISTNVSHDFAFPNDVTVNGNLNVLGTTTSLQTEIVTIEDNIILLNSNVAGPPTVDAGIEIERGSSDNVQLVWDEDNDSWQLRDTSGNPILEAFDTGNVEVANDLTITNSVIGSSYQSDDSVIFDIDKDNNSSSETFKWRTNLSTQLMELDEAGDLDVLGTVSAASFSGSLSTSSILSDTGITYGIDEDNNSSVELHLWRTNGSTELMRLDEAGSLKVTGKIGINADPIAEFHNSGSTIFGLTTLSNPGSIPASTVDSNTGVVITTSAAISVTLPTPTNTASGRFFTVLHNDTSTGTLSVDSSNIGIGKGSTYVWDGSAWIPVGATGGFEVVSSDPAFPVKGDTWFNETDNQFKGWNGSITVILG